MTGNHNTPEYFTVLCEDGHVFHMSNDFAKYHVQDHPNSTAYRISLSHWGFVPLTGEAS